MGPSSSDLTSIEHSCKVEITLTIVKACKENGEKVLLFSKSIPTLSKCGFFADGLTPQETEWVQCHGFPVTCYSIEQIFLKKP